MRAAFPENRWVEILCLALLLLMPAAWAGGSETPLSQRQILGLLQGGVASQRIAHVVEVRGINFQATPEFLDQLRNNGAQKVLLDALRAANQQLSPQAEAFAEKNQEAKEEVEKAKELLNHGLWAPAETELRKSIQLDPRNPAAHFYLGHALGKEKKWNEAVAEDREAIVLAPDSGSAHCNLGNALLAQHDLKGAAAEYRQALSLAPDDAKSNYALGVTLYDADDFSGAAMQFSTAVRLDPSDIEARCALALALFRQNNLNGAVMQYREALRLNPKHAPAHAGLAYVLLREGERKEAIEQFRMAAALAPQDVNYRATYERLAGQPDR